MLAMESLIVVSIMEICRDTTARDWPVEDIRCINSFFSFGELFFIDKILPNSSTLNNLCISFLGFVATILGKQEVK